MVAIKTCDLVGVFVVVDVVIDVVVLLLVVLLQGLDEGSERVAIAAWRDYASA